MPTISSLSESALAFLKKTSNLIHKQEVVHTA